MNDDMKLKQLIEISVYDPARREMYLDALPKMTAEEKVKVMAVCWEMLMEKMHDRLVRKMATMVEDSDNDYEEKDYKRAQDEIFNEFIAGRLNITDADEIEALRKELEQIGEKVEEHDQVLSDIAKKFSS